MADRGFFIEDLVVGNTYVVNGIHANITEGSCGR